MARINTTFTSIDQIQNEYLNGRNANNTKPANTSVSFDEILKSKTNVDEIKFSKHANLRLEQRDITLSTDQRERLIDGVSKASEKGIKESLVLVDKLAFIVNVPNNTVVTAMDSTEADSNIFTNIDGAVIN